MLVSRHYSYLRIECRDFSIANRLDDRRVNKIEVIRATATKLTWQSTAAAIAVDRDA
jgi:hypothetical protein